MYDSPLENFGTIEWLQRRQHELSLLTQSGVQPLTTCGMDTFEALMFLAKQGRHLGHLLLVRFQPSWRRVRFNVFLRSQSSETHFRLREVDERFDILAQRSLTRLRNEARLPQH